MLNNQIKVIDPKNHEMLCKHHGHITQENIYFSKRYCVDKVSIKTRCRLCSNEYRKINSEKIKATKKKNAYKDNMRRRKGIVYEQFLNKLKEQNNVCAICNKEETCKSYAGNAIKRLSIDHCHKSGKIRGLLCQRCNTAFGMLYEDIKIMQNMINYKINHG